MVISRCVSENSRSDPSRSARKAIEHPSVKELAAFSWRGTLLLATLAFVGCSAHSIGSNESQSLTPSRAAAVDEGVRVFMQSVALDVTQEGPLA